MRVDDRFRLGTIALVCLTFAALAIGGGAQAKKKITVTITGEIHAAEMRGDKVSAVYIDAADQGEFIVLRGSDISKKLVKQVGRRIHATGYTGEALREKGFDTFIDILEYEILAAAELPAKN